MIKFRYGTLEKWNNFFFLFLVLESFVKIFPGQNNEKSILQMGLEPMTLGLLDPRSNQLSYKSCGVQSKNSGEGPVVLGQSANFNFKFEV
jgi:hypothetical protein